MDIIFEKIPYLGEEIKKRPNLKKVAENIGWLSFDRIFRMGVGLFVGPWVARYLGPEQYGILNYAIAFSSIFGTIASFGIDQIVIRDLVNEPQKTNDILGTAFCLKLIGGSFSVAFSVLAVLFLNKGDILIRILVLLVSLGFIFQSFLAIDLYFQSQVKSKLTVYSQNIAFIVISVYKLFLIIKKASLIYFAFAGLMEVILGSFFLVWIYSSRNGSGIRAWRFKYPVAIKLIKNGWPLILANVATGIYMRIDQIMIGKMLNSESVGFYSAAVKITDVWYIIPTIITNSVFPSLVQSKKTSSEMYYKRLRKLFFVVIYLAVVISLPVTFLSKWIITSFYGVAYSSGANVLAVYIWASVFVFLGIASGPWFIIENLQNYSFYKTFSGAIINILLNSVLIPKYSILGAAWATIISQFLVSVLFNLFNERTKVIFYVQIKSFLGYKS